VIPYQISFEQRPEYLHVTVSGESSTATIRRYVREIREACVRLGMSRVLAVVNLNGPSVSMLDLYKVISQGSDQCTWQKM
jgi:hypothetical protein